MYNNAQINSSSTLHLLLHFVSMATRATCLLQNAFSNSTLHSIVGYVEIFMS